MREVCIDFVRGDTPPTPEIESAVENMIDETTGVQTIVQMERLAAMVAEAGLVPPEQRLDAAGYKRIYLDRLMEPVRERIAEVESGKTPAEQWMVRGAVDFLRRISEMNVTLCVFSGTDRDDVRNEARLLGVSGFFSEIWGALGNIEAYSKEKVIREIMADHHLEGPEVLAIGDGPVELRNVKAAGGIAIGVASNEKTGHGLDPRKRKRLIDAGADIIIPDFTVGRELLDYLFPGGKA